MEVPNKVALILSSSLVPLNIIMDISNVNTCYFCEQTFTHFVTFKVAVLVVGHILLQV